METISLRRLESTRDYAFIQTSIAPPGSTGRTQEDNRYPCDRRKHQRHRAQPTLVETLDDHQLVHKPATPNHLGQGTLQRAASAVCFDFEPPRDERKLWDKHAEDKREAQHRDPGAVVRLMRLEHQKRNEEDEGWRRCQREQHRSPGSAQEGG